MWNLLGTNAVSNLLSLFAPSCNKSLFVHQPLIFFTPFNLYIDCRHATLIHSFILLFYSLIQWHLWCLSELYVPLLYPLLQIPANSVTYRAVKSLSIASAFLLNRYVAASCRVGLRFYIFFSISFRFSSFVHCSLTYCLSTIFYINCPLCSSLHSSPYHRVLFKNPSPNVSYKPMFSC